MQGAGWFCEAASVLVALQVRSDQRYDKPQFNHLPMDPL